MKLNCHRIFLLSRKHNIKMTIKFVVFYLYNAMLSILERYRSNPLWVSLMILNIFHLILISFSMFFFPSCNYSDHQFSIISKWTTILEISKAILTDESEDGSLALLKLSVCFIEIRYWILYSYSGMYFWEIYFYRHQAFVNCFIKFWKYIQAA